MRGAAGQRFDLASDQELRNTSSVGVSHCEPAFFKIVAHGMRTITNPLRPTPRRQSESQIDIHCRVDLMQIVT
ncbi:hypothetical protein GCM10017600_75020 [Streptosporangium carneum]|uniref:Uncharacterized protein n=1 Tax=Streptosporangium carneum TaxID=47481 RepID=A0A9W6IAV8_9ACTN|nr:hypothetical protein GCM10017600_75020 [Streptosporangium carneum]